MAGLQASRPESRQAGILDGIEGAVRDRLLEALPFQEQIPWHASASHGRLPKGESGGYRRRSSVEAVAPTCFSAVSRHPIR